MNDVPHESAANDFASGHAPTINAVGYAAEHSFSSRKRIAFERDAVKPMAFDLYGTRCS